MFDFFAESPQQAWKLQPTLTDYVNIAPDPQKILNYRQVGSTGTPTLKQIQFPCMDKYDDDDVIFAST